MQRDVSPRAARTPWRAAARGVAAAWLCAAAISVLAAPPPAPADGVPAAATGWVHALAAFGAPKYARGFDHFEYVNADAPKGGTLNLANPDRRTSFDKFNSFTVRGSAPAGIEIFMFETLCINSADEPQTMYGLLAEEMLVAPDKSSITFRLNPKAAFSNGDPVTAQDVKYSYDSLTSQYAAPEYQAKFSDGVKAAVIVDDRTIRFDLTNKNTATMFKLGGLYIFSHKWGLKPDGMHVRFDELLNEIPLLSGPYTVARHESGRLIELKRNPAYWAKNLGVRRGLYNWDRVLYRYYKDETVSTEAFKANEYDLVKVYSARIWARAHVGQKWDDGRIVKTAFPTRNGIGLQSFQINLRRPIFADIRVREAITLSYDFETNNRYRRFKRANSVFNNSEFAAVGNPSPGELKLLEPFRAELPKEVFGPPYLAPRNDTDENALRRNLLKARSLLEQAGWKLAADGKLRNAKGEPFTFEYLSATGQNTDPRMNPWRRNLDKLGITLPDRKVDYALFSQRLTDFNFDMVTIVEPAFTLPQVSDYTDLYGSKAADEKGSGNLRGVKSKAADHALEAMANAPTIEDFRDACRALDRIVMWSYWQVPELYGDTEDVSYWDKFGMPAVQAKYFQIDNSPILTPLIAWPLATWWIKDPAQRR
ncbi:MAG TPA: extracellular solute-binding protein [Burkholderiaceae bacterium]|nr:extracellular solute-binding protein [Burkholderiaceae bacterium]